MTTQANAVEQIFDCAVVGAGVSGLNCSMNLRFENKTTILADTGQHPGGQAGSSSLIRNMPGFPGGISGPDLTVLMTRHAAEFGTTFRAPFYAGRLERADDHFVLIEMNGQTIRAKTVVIATGVQPRTLPDATKAGQFIGFGVTYGFPSLNQSRWHDTEAVVMGSGNSGAQAVQFLAGCNGCNVTMLVRRDTIRDSMSARVADEIEKPRSNVKLLYNTELVEAIGEVGKLTHLKVKTPSGEQLIKTDHLFVNIGGDPPTRWLDKDLVPVNNAGYILTDRDLPEGVWADKSRPAFMCEASPGIFACGDVRFGNFRKRASMSAVDGANAAASVVQYLALK
ncbi:MAG: thioredoxin reductase [Candidatus Kaiserbacteria bacterium]|nr:thioredoxin reductase [Candidatus Kaiserbacteria bacterium]